MMINVLIFAICYVEWRGDSKIFQRNYNTLLMRLKKGTVFLKTCESVSMETVNLALRKPIVYDNQKMMGTKG